jgi:hypothetical protein
VGVDAALAKAIWIPACVPKFGRQGEAKSRSVPPEVKADSHGLMLNKEISNTNASTQSIPLGFHGL